MHYSLDSVQCMKCANHIRVIEQLVATLVSPSSFQILEILIVSSSATSRCTREKVCEIYVYNYKRYYGNNYHKTIIYHFHSYFNLWFIVIRMTINCAKDKELSSRQAYEFLFVRFSNRIIIIKKYDLEFFNTCHYQILWRYTERLTTLFAWIPQIINGDLAYAITRYKQARLVLA